MICLYFKASAQQIVSFSLKYIEAQKLYHLENKKTILHSLIVESHTVNRFRTSDQSKGKIYWQNCCWQVLDFVSETVQVSTT